MLLMQMLPMTTMTMTMPVLRWMRVVLVALAATVVLMHNLAAQAAPAFLQGPYVDVTQGLKPDVPSAAGGSPRVLVWAFATGACTQERWGTQDDAAFAKTQVRAFVAAGQGYVISTGGEAAGFVCDSDTDLAAFVARYESPQLLGLDFDIERQQTPAQIGALVRTAAALQRARPALRISFTLATHAGSDGTQRSLNATGEQVMAALAAARLDSAIVNLMVMNYGAADPRWCVVRGAAAAARCDMGASALQAARNVHLKYGWPYAQMALTAMLGENDVAGNVFTLGDADLMLRGARELGLAGVHWWSQGRDRPCAAGSPPDTPRVSPLCHGLPGVTPGRFGALLGAKE